MSLKEADLSTGFFLLFQLIDSFYGASVGNGPTIEVGGLGAPGATLVVLGGAI